MGGVLGGALTGDSMVLLGDLNTHTGRSEPERCAVPAGPPFVKARGRGGGVQLAALGTT